MEGQARTSDLTTHVGDMSMQMLLVLLNVVVSTRYKLQHLTH